uniref:Uncharacterized protein n=1 Tax=Magallana gigas TaxID=29159 RepID=K1S5Q2_MAGGI
MFGILDINISVTIDMEKSPQALSLAGVNLPVPGVGSKMGKIYDLLIEPFVNIVEKRRSQREVALREGRPPTDALAVNQGNRPTPAVLTQRDEATSEELSRKEEEECLTCKVIAISTLMMYGTAIILIPTTEKYKQSMKKYLANKNYVLLIFAVHSFVGSGCFAGAVYQGYKLSEMLARRKSVEE